MTHTASGQMVERLIERDADTTVGLAGDGVKGFYGALRTRQDRSRLTHVRHETVAIHGMLVVAAALTGVFNSVRFAPRRWRKV